MHYLIILIEMAVLLLATFLIMRQRSVELFSPVYIFLIYYLLIYSVGWFVSPLEFGDGGVSANIVLNDSHYDLTLQYGIGICLFFSFGVLFNLYVLQIGLCSRIKFIKLLSRTSMAPKVWPVVRALAMLLSFVALFLVVMGVGLSNLWYREVYLPVEIRSAKIIGIALTPIAVISIGYIFLYSKFLFKLLVIAMLSIFFVVFFSLASRWFALIPVLFMLGVLMSKPDAKVVRIVVLLSAVLSFFLLLVPLSFRPLETHGLLPYLSAFQSDVVVMDWGTLGKMTNNLLFSFSLTGHVAIYEDIDLKYLFISLNPLPGGLANWYSAAEVLRVNQYTPFNAPGELLNHGVSVAAVFYFLLGIYFSRIDNKIGLYLARNKLLIPALFMGLAILYTVSSLQYNLRSGVRFLYYMIALELIFYVPPAFLRSIKRSHDN